MAKKNTLITRKIKLNIDAECKEQYVQELKKWSKYNNIVRRCANIIVSHIFVHDNISDMFYLTEDFKVKLLKNDEKTPDGVLTTSKTNSTYQLLSKHFKGEIPTVILSALNNNICKTHKEQSMDIRNGLKSIPSYKNNIPIPITRQSFCKVKRLDDMNFSFTLFGTPFVTYFGRDRSYNKNLLNKAFNELEGYKLCDSSIKIEKNGSKTKFYLNAVISVPKTANNVDPEKSIECFLDYQHPIIIADKKSTKIGTEEEFNHARVYIKNKLIELQKSLKYNNGGKGRKKKLQAIERYKQKEKNYVRTKLHTYSRELINYCLRNNVGKIILSNYPEIEDANLTERKDDKEKFLISTWSYYGLSQMIIYKAAMNNIEVVIPEDSEDRESIDEHIESDKVLA